MTAPADQASWVESLHADQFVHRRLVGGAVLAISAAYAQDRLPGATVDGLLDLPRTGNPDLAVSAAERQASAAKAETAGALPDPNMRFTADEIDRTGGGRLDRYLYTVEQEIPFWGKRELRSRAAVAELSAARARESGVGVRDGPRSIAHGRRSTHRA